MRQRLSQLKEQLGWQGISGVVLLALAGAFHFLSLQPLEQEVSYIHSRLEAVKSKSKNQAGILNDGDRQGELRAFFDSLPREEDVTDILASISEVAEASQIEFKQAEYQLGEKGKTQMEYGLVFPVKGGYANIRHFVFRVLADHHALALDQINFRRDVVNDSVLNAEIRFTLFLRAT